MNSLNDGMSGKSDDGMDDGMASMASLVVGSEGHFQEYVRDMHLVGYRFMIGANFLKMEGIVLFLEHHKFLNRLCDENNVFSVRKQLF